MSSLSAGWAFVWAVGGGAAVEIVGLYRVRKSNFPQWLRTKRYWVSTVGMIIVGGGLAYAYAASGYGLHPVVAVNVGVAAPLVIERLTAATPEIPVGRIDIGGS